MPTGLGAGVYDAGLPVLIRVPCLPMAVPRTEVTMARLKYRFRVGDTVWVRDRRRRGYCIVEAVVRERHFHPGRHPAYPHGEGYALNGELWWDCYPGCRVFGTRAEATAARLGDFNKEHNL